MAGIPADHAVKFASIHFDVRTALPGSSVYLSRQRRAKVVF
jgi:hypothetical protein